MELWNSLPDNLSHLDLSLTVPLSADDASILTESVAPSDLYFSALTEFTYLLTLQKKQLKQYIISCKTVADRPTLKITVLNTKNLHYRLAMAVCLTSHFSLPSATDRPRCLTVLPYSTGSSKQHTKNTPTPWLIITPMERPRSTMISIVQAQHFD